MAYIKCQNETFSNNIGIEIESLSSYIFVLFVHHLLPYIDLTMRIRVAKYIFKCTSQIPSGGRCLGYDLILVHSYMLGAIRSAKLSESSMIANATYSKLP